MEREEEIKLLESIVARTAEHWDTVQIFVTRHEGECARTVSIASGLGNWFARRGQVAEWVVKQDSIAMDEATPEEEGRDAS